MQCSARTTQTNPHKRYDKMSQTQYAWNISAYMQNQSEWNSSLKRVEYRSFDKRLTEVWSPGWTREVQGDKTELIWQAEVLGQRKSKVSNRVITKSRKKAELSCSISYCSEDWMMWRCLVLSCAGWLDDGTGVRKAKSHAQQHTQTETDGTNMIKRGRGNDRKNSGEGRGKASVLTKSTHTHTQFTAGAGCSTELCNSISCSLNEVYAEPFLTNLACLISGLDMIERDKVSLVICVCVCVTGAIHCGAVDVRNLLIRLKSISTAFLSAVKIVMFAVCCVYTHTLNIYLLSLQHYFQDRDVLLYLTRAGDQVS